MRSCLSSNPTFITCHLFTSSRGLNTSNPQSTCWGQCVVLGFLKLWDWVGLCCEGSSSRVFRSILGLCSLDGSNIPPPPSWACWWQVQNDPSAGGELRTTALDRRGLGEQREKTWAPQGREQHFFAYGSGPGIGLTPQQPPELLQGQCQILNPDLLLCHKRTLKATFLVFGFFCLFRATPAACGGSQLGV